LMPAPIPVADAAVSAEWAAFVSEFPDFPLAFQTVGESVGALRQLERFRDQSGFTWQASHVWWHEAEPRVGAGFDADAEQLLRHHVAAAAAGVGEVLWFDLRDDDNDPAQPAALRGLVRRDFSPKLALLGYATAAGTLTGYRYAGPLRGTPDALDGALFIGANRQVAALLPRPNRIMPAVLFPALGAPGELAARDFERRTLPALQETGTAFAPVARPFFFVLTLRAPQSEPQLALAPLWLRVPQTVFFGRGQTSAIEVDVQRPLSRGYLQLRLPRDSPLQSSVAAVALQGAPGDTVRVPIELVATGDQVVERDDLALRVSLDGANLDVPLVARRLTDVIPLSATQSLTTPAHHLGDLIARRGRPTAQARLYAAHDAQSLHLALMVDDDRIVPLRLDRRRQATGDQILLGLAAEGAWHGVQVRFDPTARPLRPQPLYGSRPEWLGQWRGGATAGEGRVVTYQFQVPLRSLTDGEPVGGQRLLLAACYVDDDADGFPPVLLSWGEGLTEGPATVEYQWIRLGDGSGG